MGGINESVVAQKAQSESVVKQVPPSAEASVPVAASNDILDIRMHVSGGEVHFHADDVGLKCAIPAADWFSVWNQISNRPNERITRIDKKTGVKAVFIGFLNSRGEYDIRVSLEQYAKGVGPMYNAMEKLLNG